MSSRFWRRSASGGSHWSDTTAGAWVATRLVKDHPEVVDRLVVIDNVPTRIVAREMNGRVAREYWFFMFHQISDLPEALIAGREDIWLRHFFSDWCHDPTTISGEAFETYVKAYSAPGAVRGAMSDYRASGEDIAQDLEDADRKIGCPYFRFGEKTSPPSVVCST
jgi:haloacetate dehalogenase